MVQLKFIRTPAFWSNKLGVLKRKSKTAFYITNAAEDAKVLETHWNCFVSGFLRSVSLRRKIEERPRFPGNSLQLTTTDPRVKWVRLQFKSCRRRPRRFPKIHRSPINWPRILTQNLCLHLNKFFFSVLSSNPHQKRTSNTKIWKRNTSHWILNPRTTWMGVKLSLCELKKRQIQTRNCLLQRSSYFRGKMSKCLGSRFEESAPD